MAPGISLRESIRWLPDQASEPTSTIVLTSPENRFVDIRIYKPQHERELVEAKEGNIPTLTHCPVTVALMALDVLPSSRLEWAFAGTSSSELRHPEEGKAVVHSKWRHWVDCRNPDADGVVDEGDMYPQTDGRTLEKGSMVNPATGKLTEYEELWKDLDPTVIKKEPKEDAPKVSCVVLQLQDDEHEARGVVVRLGQYCQGVLRVGKHFSLERWEWKCEKEGWKRLVRIGDLWVPCGVATEDERLALDGEVKHGEYVWKVIEKSYF